MTTLACAGCEDWFEPDDDHVRIEASVEQGTRFSDVRLSCLNSDRDGPGVLFLTDWFSGRIRSEPLWRKSLVTVLLAFILLDY